MNFTRAIQAHSDWKLRLSAYCEGTLTEAIDIGKLTRDDACELGQWLFGEGRRFNADPKFSDLILAHAAFHRAAGKIAALIESGQRGEGKRLMQFRDSDFGKCSSNVVGLLMRFRDRYGNT
jgi:methyl-accepting chemotaxis protein